MLVTFKQGFIVPKSPCASECSCPFQGPHLRVDVGCNDHGRPLAVSAAGLVVGRLVPDDPSIPFSEQCAPHL